MVRRRLFFVLAFVLLALLAGCRRPSEPVLRVEGAWARPAMKMGGSAERGATTALFLTLVNEGGKADRLVGAETAVAEVVELHRTQIDEQGVMRMRPVEGGLEVPAGGRVELKPGGYHLMLLGLTRDLAVGDRFRLTLRFETSPPLEVEVEVRETEP